MTLEQRLASLGALVEQMQDFDSEEWSNIKLQAKLENPWFSEKNTLNTLLAIRDQYLNDQNLSKWLSNYNINDSQQVKSVGMILAGNIPAVGWHDVLTCYISGHKSLIKLSDKDKVIITHLISKLISIDPRNKEYFSFVSKLEGHDAVIATGSNNTSTTFEYYFGKYPNIIRRNRNAVAVLHPTDGPDVITKLGNDIFTYFGLGCRNVSKIYVPQNYDVTKILEVLHDFNEVVQHHKYFSNFEYNMAVYMLNKEHYLNNGSIILKEDVNIGSRIASLHYEYYENLDDLGNTLGELEAKIQCVVSSQDVPNIKTIQPGEAQKPDLWDYADGVDTLDFLLGL